MTNDQDICYRALKSRDARFDGVFFTGVKTTGIYCRPVCPAVTPLRRNVTFFSCATAAEKAGFRPCLRCRPETSPGTPAWLGSSASVSRALRYINEGYLEPYLDFLRKEYSERKEILQQSLQKHLPEGIRARPAESRLAGGSRWCGDVLLDGVHHRRGIGGRL